MVDKIVGPNGKEEYYKEIMADKDRSLVNHWGITVDSEIPITGVLANNDILWLQDAMYYEDGINLTFEEHVSEYHDGDYDACNESCWMDDGSETWLIGDWRKDDDGLYEPREDGPRGYAAIVREIYTQVVFSKHTVRCALCSPCYPGQGDVGSEGPFLAYTMPP